MSCKEIERYEAFKRFQRQEISLHQVATLLRLSYRQTKRLWKAFQQFGKEGLISKRRGKNSPRAYSETLKKEILAIIQADYVDFGPTLISEKLKECHTQKISKETLRKWMIAANLWISKSKKTKVYQRRERRSCRGELLQADGSHHRWFEDRGPDCVLLVAIDDATGEVTARFEEGETTAGYFRLMHEYTEINGTPAALYTDRYGVFKVNKGDEIRRTQFGRAMKELAIEMIYASSPQAKGRVERVNRTLQDRLVKELRLNKISTIEAANAFLPVFLAKFNKQFSKKPASSFNAHRPLKQERDLKYILCEKSTRRVSKNLEISYEGEIYQLDALDQRNRLQGQKVTMMRTLDRELVIDYRGRRLNYKKFKEIEALPILDSKELNSFINKKKWKPPKEHPWRKTKTA